MKTINRLPLAVTWRSLSATHSGLHRCSSLHHCYRRVPGRHQASDFDRTPGVIDPDYASLLPAEIQKRQVTIVEGEGESSVYDMLPCPVQFRLFVRGGPYTTTVEDLVQPQKLPTGGVTRLGVNVPDAGEAAPRLN